LSPIKGLLKQLKPSELLQLARKKGARIPDKVSKSKLVTILEPFVTEKEVLEIFHKPGETGLKGVVAGSNFERKCMGTLHRMGFSCRLNVTVNGGEFDIIGKKDGGFLESTKWILAECKNKPKVILDDFNKFLGKFMTFQKRHSDDEVYGYFLTSGVFDRLVKSAKRQHSEIQLRRVKA
jgi:hypothetical protein